jgi:hypothetical protein
MFTNQSYSSSQCWTTIATSVLSLMLFIQDTQVMRQYLFRWSVPCTSYLDKNVCLFSYSLNDSCRSSCFFLNCFLAKHDRYSYCSFILYDWYLSTSRQIPVNLVYRLTCMIFLIEWQSSLESFQCHMTNIFSRQIISMSSKILRNDMRWNQLKSV